MTLDFHIDDDPEVYPRGTSAGDNVLKERRPSQIPAAVRRKDRRRRTGLASAKGVLNVPLRRCQDAFLSQRGKSCHRKGHRTF